MRCEGREGGRKAGVNQGVVVEKITKRIGESPEKNNEKRVRSGLQNSVLLRIVVSCV